MIRNINTFNCPKSVKDFYLFVYLFCLIGQDLPKNIEEIVLGVDILLAFVNILFHFGRMFFQVQFHTESNLLLDFIPQQSCLGMHTPKFTIATTRHEYP